jgi:hypothetical protein
VELRFAVGLGSHLEYPTANNSVPVAAHRAFAPRMHGRLFPNRMPLFFAVLEELAVDARQSRSRCSNRHVGWGR